MKKIGMSDLAQEVIKGNHRAIARAISLVENDRSAAREMMKKIFAHTGQSIIVGITGSPGSGKSTLVDQMAGILRKNEKKIGIVAVDPSSPFSGGAILGDRIRMMQHSVDPEIFIRSMATRGQLGGLAKATGEAIAVLEAVEVVKLADIILVILIPGAGDEIQVFKAGIMEIADIFILNKADSPLADRTEKQLKAMLDLGLVGKTPPPVIKTVATEGKGVNKLIKEIEKLVMDRDQELRDSRKKRLIPWMLMDIISEKIYHSVTQNIKASEFEDFIERIHRRNRRKIKEKHVTGLRKNLCG